MGSGSMLEGVVVGIDTQWFQRRIADSAYQLERSFNDGTRLVVGVNTFTEGDGDEAITLQRITDADEQRQVERLRRVLANRDDAQVELRLDALRAGAREDDYNLMPLLIDCATALVTIGEMTNALADVFGRYHEVPSL